MDICQAVVSTQHVANKNPIFSLGGVSEPNKKIRWHLGSDKKSHPILHRAGWLVSLKRTKLLSFSEWVSEILFFCQERLKMLVSGKGFLGNTYYIFVSRIMPCIHLWCHLFPWNFRHFFRAYGHEKPTCKKPSARPEVFFQTQSLVPCNTRRGNLGLQGFQAISGDEDDIGNKNPEHVEIDLFQNGIIHVQVYSQMFLVMYQQVCTTTKCRYLHPMNP